MKLHPKMPVYIRCVRCSKLGTCDPMTFKPAGWYLGLGLDTKKGLILVGPWCLACRKLREPVEVPAPVPDEIPDERLH